MLDGCAGRGEGGDLRTCGLMPSKALDAALLGLEHDLCMWLPDGRGRKNDRPNDTVSEREGARRRSMALQDGRSSKMSATPWAVDVHPSRPMTAATHALICGRVR